MRFPIMPQGARRRLCAGVLLASVWLLPAAMAKAEVRLASAEALDTQIGDVRAGRGRMLLVPPFGGEVVSERFDAARLHDALGMRAFPSWCWALLRVMVAIARSPVKAGLNP